MMEDMAPPSTRPADKPAETRVLLTIDTEFTWRPGADLSRWETAYERSYEAAGVGVPYQLGLLAQHALKACFFIDPMPASIYGVDPIRRMIEPILEAGQEVQLHPHPLWINAIEGETLSEPQIASYDRAAQRDLIMRARDFLVAAGAPEPIAFRGGNYSANDDTLQVLAELGFTYDSSHNGHQHPWPSAIGLPTDQITPVERFGMIEIPVTLIAEGRYSRHLQICAVSAGEMKAAIKAAGDAQLPIVNIVTHSFELANRAATAPNNIHVRRFESLCGFLSAERKRFPTTFFRELGDLPLGLPSTVLPNGGFRRMGRMIEQIWSNRIEERGT